MNRQTYLPPVQEPVSQIPYLNSTLSYKLPEQITQRLDMTGNPMSINTIVKSDMNTPNSVGFNRQNFGGPSSSSGWASGPNVASPFLGQRGTYAQNQMQQGTYGQNQGQMQQNQMRPNVASPFLGQQNQGQMQQGTYGQNQMRPNVASPFLGQQNQGQMQQNQGTYEQNQRQQNQGQMQNQSRQMTQAPPKLTRADYNSIDLITEVFSYESKDWKNVFPDGVAGDKGFMNALRKDIHALHIGIFMDDMSQELQEEEAMVNLEAIQAMLNAPATVQVDSY